MKTNEIHKLLENVIKGLCRHKEEVRIGIAELQHSVSYSISVCSQDQAKVIGARGCNINAIKHLFEQANALDPNDYKLKKIRVFLESPDDERQSVPEKFEKNPNWESAQYKELAEDLLALSFDAKVNSSDLGGISVFECEVFEEIDKQSKDYFIQIISAIGKCNGGTIEVSFV
tara:strand:- start:613 stop:1131 length:519 start_codon:yes stop_codon:yes gene_type:complete